MQALPCALFVTVSMPAVRARAAYAIAGEGRAVRTCPWVGTALFTTFDLDVFVSPLMPTWQASYAVACVTLVPTAGLPSCLLVPSVPALGSEWEFSAGHLLCPAAPEWAGCEVSTFSPRGSE